MELRQRLLAAFTSVALLVITLFGFVAQRIANEHATEEEFHLLTAFAQDKASNLSGMLDKIESENIITFLSHQDNKSQPVVLLDKHSQIVATNQQASTFGHKLLSKHISTFKQHQSSGSFNINNNRVLWSMATVPDTPYRLLVMHLADTDISFLRTVGARLFVTGIVIIWISIWGALILSSLISKRLDKQNAILIHQALHDRLTDLPNRNLLYDRLQQAMYYYRRDGLPVSLLLLGLKRFKDINDTLGHRSGDILLKQIGPRLHSILWEPDTIARLDSDVFAVIAPNVNQQNIGIVINKIIKALEKPFTIDDLELITSATIGVAFYPDHAEDPDTLIRKADVAMYQAKKHGREYVIYSPDSDSNSIEQLTLMSELRQAINSDTLELYYQPKINIRTNRVIGVEALIRWQHPVRGFIPPDEFIPKAEQTGLIKPLTEWVLNQAMRQAQEWRKQNINISVAINVSQRSLYDQQLINQLAELMQQLNIYSCGLDIEITETTIMSDPTMARASLNALHKMGVTVSIDDFGTGFTSLAYLKELPVDELKIDKSFVMNMINDNNDVVIVSSIIELAHSMGRSVVAEGVESEEILGMLKALDCDIAQGFYFAKPMPASEFEQWLSRADYELYHHRKNKLA